MEFDKQMRATWVMTVAVFAFCGYIVTDDKFSKELKIGAFGLVSSITFWYAPSPITSMMKRQNLEISQQEESENE